MGVHRPLSPDKSPKIKLLGGTVRIRRFPGSQIPAVRNQTAPGAILITSAITAIIPVSAAIHNTVASLL